MAELLLSARVRQGDSQVHLSPEQPCRRPSLNPLVGPPESSLDGPRGHCIRPATNSTTGQLGVNYRMRGRERASG